MCTLNSMTVEEKSVHKKSRGRPAGRTFRETIPVRLTAEMLAAVDRWATSKKLSRSEAMRLLIQRGLKKGRSES